jgi:hypothetical protein
MIDQNLAHTSQETRYVSALGYPVPGGNKYWNLTIQVGRVSKIETIKYAHESR